MNEDFEKDFTKLASDVGDSMKNYINYKKELGIDTKVDLSVIEKIGKDNNKSTDDNKSDNNSKLTNTLSSNKSKYNSNTNQSVNSLNKKSSNSNKSNTTKNNNKTNSDNESDEYDPGFIKDGTHLEEEAQK